MSQREIQEERWLKCLYPSCKTFLKYHDGKPLSGRKIPFDTSNCTGCRWCDWNYEFNNRLALEKKNQHLKSNPESEYAFTLTQPPGHNDKSGRTIEECAEHVLTKGMTSKCERPKYWAYVKEFTDAGTPHIHGVYATNSGNRICDKYFKRAWELWDPKVPMGAGHKGGYHRLARHAESYNDYMTKEGVVVKSPIIDSVTAGASVSE